MRYLVFCLLGLLGVVVSGSTAYLMGPIYVDIALLLVMAVALVEKPVTPVVFAAATGLFMDIMYSSNIGMHALSYTVVALIAQMLFGNMKKQNVLTVFLVGMGGFILNDVITGIFAYVQGVRTDFLEMALRSILPSAILSGALLIIVYFLINKLLAQGWMKRKSHHGDDFGHIG